MNVKQPLPIYAVSLGKKYIELRTAAEAPKRLASSVLREWTEKVFVRHDVKPPENKQLAEKGYITLVPVYKDKHHKTKLITVYFEGGKVIGALSRWKFVQVFGKDNTPKVGCMLCLTGEAEATARGRAWRKL